MIFDGEAILRDERSPLSIEVMLIEAVGTAAARQANFGV
jgi:hypothetical protein